MEPRTYHCSFCGKIINGISRPIVISFELAPDEHHNLYCHLACLRNSLHPTMPLGAQAPE